MKFFEDKKEVIWIDQNRKGKLSVKMELDLLDMDIRQLETNERGIYTKERDE